MVWKVNKDEFIKKIDVLWVLVGFYGTKWNKKIGTESGTGISIKP